MAGLAWLSNHAQADHYDSPCRPRSGGEGYFSQASFTITAAVDHRCSSTVQPQLQYTVPAKSKPPLEAVWSYWIVCLAICSIVGMDMGHDDTVLGICTVWGASLPATVWLFLALKIVYRKILHKSWLEYRHWEYIDL